MPPTGQLLSHTSSFHSIIAVKLRPAHVIGKLVTHWYHALSPNVPAARDMSIDIHTEFGLLQAIAKFAILVVSLVWIAGHVISSKSICDQASPFFLMAK